VSLEVDSFAHETHPFRLESSSLFLLPVKCKIGGEASNPADYSVAGSLLITICVESPTYFS